MESWFQGLFWGMNSSGFENLLIFSTLWKIIFHSSTKILWKMNFSRDLQVLEILWYLTSKIFHGIMFSTNLWNSTFQTYGIQFSINSTKFNFPQIQWNSTFHLFHEINFAIIWKLIFHKFCGTQFSTNSIDINFPLYDIQLSTFLWKIISHFTIKKFVETVESCFRIFF